MQERLGLKSPDTRQRKKPADAVGSSYFSVWINISKNNVLHNSNGDCSVCKSNTAAVVHHFAIYAKQRRTTQTLKAGADPMGERGGGREGSGRHLLGTTKTS